MIGRPTAYVQEAVQLFSIGLMLMVGVVAVAASPAADERDYLVVFPPWMSGSEALRAATIEDASLLGKTRLYFLVSVHSDQTDYPSLIRAHGALFVASTRIKAGCKLLRNQTAAK